ncbi:FAD-dependent oxidoreductase [Aquitalea pelogenes]|uniref:FAD-dependent oxidoreductase n=1 Tax=Aquitalea pelogenes TaxID=1293573 RepID=UPI0035AF9E5C
MDKQEQANTLHCDLLVVGSGAGGLATAVTAARLGLKVVVAEKEAEFGGTTAWSGGWLWVPRNPLAIAAGIDEDPALPRQYLHSELGEDFDPALADAYLSHAPRMVDFFQRHSLLRFIDGNQIPDFHGHSAGAASGGRSVCAAPFDGRLLGAHIHQLKKPLDVISLWGMGIASGVELRHFLNASRSLASFAYVTRRMLAYWRDCLLHGRGMRLVNGNALAAALGASALQAGVELRLSSPLRQLLREQDKVSGALLDTPDGPLTVHASRGVVLACGGFPHDVARKRQLLAHAPTGQEHWSAAPVSNTGDGLRLGEAVGGVMGEMASPMALAPVSLVPRADGSTAHFPHLIERAKPGLIAVTANGQRFCNEADSYHDFVSALLRATPAGQPVQAWLVADHRFVRRYGLGAVKPAPMPLGRWLRNGYLQRGNTLQELACRCGINPVALEQQVARYNQQAATGEDSDFAKGDTPYNRVQGDKDSAWPNPCMAPLQHGPYYAVKLVPGSLGSFAGLATNASAQVLDEQQHPISGLYAVGNDMHSMMGGHYPSGGITLGPAMTFGYLAAHHAAGRQPDTSI